MERVDKTYKQYLQLELAKCEAKLKTQSCPERRAIISDYIAKLKYSIRKGIWDVENSIEVPVNLL